MDKLTTKTQIKKEVARRITCEGERGDYIDEKR